MSDQHWSERHNVQQLGGANEVYSYPLQRHHDNQRSKVSSDTQQVRDCLVIAQYSGNVSGEAAYMKLVTRRGMQMTHRLSVPAAYSSTVRNRDTLKAPNNTTCCPLRGSLSTRFSMAMQTMMEAICSRAHHDEGESGVEYLGKVEVMQMYVET